MDKPKSYKHRDKFIKLGRKVSYYRKIRGLTQIQLAEKIVISRTYMSNIEAINVPLSFSISSLFDIAEALEIKPSQLLEFEDLDGI